MICNRAFEIDLDDLLIDPDSEDLRHFEIHAQDCPDCAAELELQRALLGRLSDSLQVDIGKNRERLQWAPVVTPAVALQRAVQAMVAAGDRG